MVNFLLAQLTGRPAVTRSVFYPDCETSYPASSLLHYYTACKVYYQTITKYSKPDLPRCVVSSPWESLHSVTHIDNGAQAKLFEEKKRTFLQEGKVDEFGSVRETFLFHGSSKESINKIVEGHFDIDFSSARGSRMLFGRGVYFSQLPGVSLMYGEGLLLCKVLLGKREVYHPQGQTPPPIADNYDSREVIRDGVGVITVVCSVDQILPYCIINVKHNLLSQAGNVSSSSTNTNTTTNSTTNTNTNSTTTNTTADTASKP